MRGGIKSCCQRRRSFGDSGEPVPEFLSIRATVIMYIHYFPYEFPLKDYYLSDKMINFCTVFVIKPLDALCNTRATILRMFKIYLIEKQFNSLV